ncbi:MAG: glutamine synthetase [Bradymonadaceae bacterium]|nr:glutamine synthetase [Lujinxingiaceae bacterium]
MATRGLSAEEILEQVKASGTSRVRVAAADIDGILRGKFMHTSKFLSAAESGFGFCNVVFGWDSADVCYDKVDYTGWHTGYPDVLAKIDLSTYRKVPWDNDVPFFLGDFVDADGQALAICPRQLLKRTIAEAKDMGFSPKFGMEFEWFNFLETPKSANDKGFVGLEPLTPGMFGYSILRTSNNAGFFRALMEEMEAFGIPIEGLHTETGPGVYEVAILYDDPLEAADRGVLFKTAAKEIAYRFGIMATFMAKVDSKLPGCSGHMHQSLWSEAGENLFYDAKGRHTMSAIFESYLAGQLLGLSDLLPFYAPTINSYKRLVKGLWAPTHVTWGVDNRTPALRVIPGSPRSTRLETRISGADINPYLGIAAALASGLYGIKKGLKLTDVAVVGNAYEVEGARALPVNLGEATQAMRSSELARELFGDTFIDHFAATRQWEWEQHQRAVTNWELKRYFEII